jgi:hypothetical protein
MVLAYTRSRRVSVPAEGSLGMRLLLLGLVAVVLAIVALQAAGKLSLLQAVVLLFGPFLLIAAGFRPGWLILILLAIPPGLLTVVRPSLLLLLVLGTLAAQIVVRGTAYLDVRSGFLPLAMLITAAFLFTAEVHMDGASAASEFLTEFGYYAVISVVSYNAVRLGDLRRDHLVNALLAGLVATALIKIAFTGFSPPTAHSPGGTFYFDRRFAYLAVLGFSVAFARWLIRRSEGRKSLWDGALGMLFLVLVGTSLVRGAWLSAMVVVLVVAGYTGRRSHWLLVPLALSLVLLVPVARERVAPTGGGEFDVTTGRWELWTTLWEDHITPVLPAGNGFGYAWSLTPNTVFGFSVFVVEGVSADRFFYPHNDFLFWMLEFGLWGLALWLLYWIHLIAATRWLLKKGDLADRHDALVVAGIFVTMLIAQLVANGFALQPLAERFFIAAGFVFGARANAARKVERTPAL